MRTLPFCACAIALAGCVEAEDRSTDFEYLHAAIIEPMCATVGCHSRQAQVPEMTPLDLSTPLRACNGLRERNMFPIPAGGMVVDMLEGEYDFMDPDYRQMPPDVPLPAADIELVRAWIEGTDPCE